MKRLFAIVLVAVMVFSLAACGGKKETEAPATEAPATEAPATEAPETDAPETDAPETQAPETDAPAAGIEGNSNYADMEMFADQSWDINKYYNDLGVEADVKYTGEGGVVNVPDKLTTALPKANEEYTIGFSVYYTVDEVGAMLLETMESAAKECGVKLLVNDANYDQDAQNQAIEQWIVEGVDGVILAPCDFYGVKGALDALKEAGIPVITLNPALAGEAQAAVMSECTEQGKMAGECLINELLANNVEMKGVIVYQTLPFIHPNAATRAKGFKDAFADYPDIEIVELTGTSPEEHYTAFEGALMNYGDKLIGAFGLYSSATIGMLSARKANNSTVPISSIDNDKVILQAIYEGECLGSACYSSTSPAYWCMSQMVDLLNGETIPSIMFYPNTMVTKDNVEEMFEFYYPGKTLKDYIDGLVD